MKTLTQSKTVAAVVAVLFAVYQCIAPVTIAFAHEGTYLDASLETPVISPFSVIVEEGSTVLPEADSPLSAPSTTTDGPENGKPTGGGGNGGGKPGNDSTAPVISSVTATNVTTASSTISWTTDDSSDSTIRYGLSSSSLTSSTSSGTRVTTHTLSLSGLTGNTIYYYCVISRNRAGLVTESAIFSFTTTADTTAPTITNVTSSSITQTDALIKWNTNEASNSTVEFGLTTSYGSSTPLDTQMVTSHSISLTGLAAGATYNYRVKSCDSNGNCTYSGNFTFTTTQAPDSSGPAISAVTVTEATATSATVSWTTNEAATSVIEYGTTTAYGFFTILDNTLVTNHLHEIINLATNTFYHFRVKSCDAGGNCTVSNDFSFTTLASSTAPTLTVNTASTQSLYQGERLFFTLSGFDLENDALTFSMTGQPGDSTFTPNPDGVSALFTWVPNSGHSGTFTLNFTVSDGMYAQTKTVTITVNANSVLVNQLDNDFTKAGFQIYEASQYSKVTYSHSSSASWELRNTSGTIVTNGTGTNAVIEYRGMAGGLYTLTMKNSTGGVVSIFTTEVFSGSWAQNNTPTLFLDFDGSFVGQWGSWSNISTPRYSTDSNTSFFSLSEIRSMIDIFWRVTEKFSIFGLFVTALDPFNFLTPYASPTDEFNARKSYYIANNKLAALVGGDAAWYGSAGGVAYVNSFHWNPFVFAFEDKLGNGNVRYTTEAIAHEAGHAFGLSHQYVTVNGVYDEYSLGTSGYAPIMGESFYAGLTGWWKGSCATGTSCQDDMSKLVTTLGLKADDHGNSLATASGFTQNSLTNFAANGVITSTTDTDYFQFTLSQAGPVTLKVYNAGASGMLDPVLELRDANGNLITFVDATWDGSKYSATLSNYNLAAGTYFLSVRGHGLINLASPYGSFYDVGQYWITATLPIGSTTIVTPAAGPSASTTPSSGSSSGGGTAGSAIPGQTKKMDEDVHGMPTADGNYFGIYEHEASEHDDEEESEDYHHARNRHAESEFRTGAQDAQGIDHALSHVPADHGQAATVLSELKEAHSEGEAPGLTFSALLRDPSLHPILAKYLV